MSLGRNQLKRRLAPIVVLVLAAAVGAVLTATAVLQSWSTEGADPAAAFNEIPEQAPDLEGIVTWADDRALQEREVEPATRRAVTAAWTRVWRALQRASDGDASLVADWFSGPALEQVRTTFAVRGGEAVPVTVGDHRLQVYFYSDDGTVLGVRADPVRLVRTLRARRLVTDETIDVVFVLEDGNWRIRQWARLDVDVVLPGS